MTANIPVSVGAFDTPFLDIGDLAGLRAQTDEVRRLGFSGKLAIRPSHAGIINDAVMPSAEQIAEARRVSRRSKAGSQMGPAPPEPSAG